ncbi:MAG: hypothetical protein NDJ19_00300 [Ramlibacter sp.]|nr:hypothetical protein [Ramlibacter sp.]
MSVALAAWSLRRLAFRTVRWLGVGGVTLVALGLLLAIAWATDLHFSEQLAMEQRRAAKIASRAGTSDAASELRVTTVTQELHAFDRRMPAAEDAMQVLADLFSLAGKHRLVLARGDYQLESDDKSALLRLQITLPLKGDTKSIHGFVQDALLANQTLAFDALTFKREHLNSEEAEAKVQMSLYTRRFANVSQDAVVFTARTSP